MGHGRFDKLTYQKIRKTVLDAWKSIGIPLNQDLEDAVQEVCAKAYEKNDYRYVKNLLIDYLRTCYGNPRSDKGKTKIKVLFGWSELDESNTADSKTDLDLQMDLIRGIDYLNDMEAVALILVEYYGHTEMSVAKTLGYSETRISQHRVSAKRKMRKFLAGV